MPNLNLNPIPLAGMALQRGINVAKKIIWKHMSATQKAKYLLKKLFGSVSR